MGRGGTTPASETTALGCQAREGVTLRLGVGPPTTVRTGNRQLGEGAGLAPAQSGGPQLRASFLGQSLWAASGWPCHVPLTPGMPQEGALPYLGPASGSSGFGRHGAGLSEWCGRHLSAGLLGGPLVKQPRPKCPPLAVVPSSGSLLLFSAGSRAWPGAGGVSPEKFNSRKQQEETAGWNLHTRQWKTSPTLGRGGRVERAVREERK